MGRTYIIAEAGVNHNGNINIAKELIVKASEAGADAIKFQTFRAKELVSATAKMADYQKKNTGKSEGQLEMLERLELSFDDFIELKKFSENNGIDFLSTPFDLKSLDFLVSLSLRYLKIPSGEITNKPYLLRIANSGIPIILSTGMSDLEEVKAALKLFEGYPKNNITILHCTTEYPAPFREINLRAMQTIKETFGYSVGYSDHTRGIEASIAAVALGATIIEKHFTLDKGMEGPDHAASADVRELKGLINSIRNIEMALGDGRKSPSDSEIKNIEIVRKSIVASRDIVAGEVFSEDNLGVKRPGDGISPMKWNEIIGRNAIRNFKKDEKIEI